MDTPKEFDFDEMASLAKDDPEEFDRRHRQLVEDLIVRTFSDKEERQRARARQSNLMQRLSLEKDPKQRKNKMVEIFWEQFNRFNDAHDPFRTSTPKQETEEQKPKESAKVIQLIPTEDS